MAKNRKTAIDSLFECAVPTGAKSGEPVLALGAIPAVLQTDEGKGVGNVAGRASVDTQGIFSFECAEAVAAEGTLVYLKTSDRTITVTAAGATAFGRSIHLPSPEGRAGGTKSSGAGTINVRLSKV